jgi:RNA polymerase sigma-70 factor (ECF subfamily)
VVSSLVRVFGISKLELIEDAVQDAFQKAVVHFRNNEIPDYPGAWLNRVARNRAIDLLRKIKLEEKTEFFSGPASIAMTEVFSDYEIEDNQLRLLFTICHPSLKSKDQVIFALKTFSGFSHAEIAHGLLISKENIKKSLSRARENIINTKISFDVPEGKDLDERLEHVHVVLYLLFNEGFHSSGKDKVVRKDLVAEALRLTGILSQRFKQPNTKALMALMCFHSARLDSKITAKNDLVKLKYQDRSLWNSALILRGNLLMEEATKGNVFSKYHYEAAIANEYVKAGPFSNINWANVEIFHRNLTLNYPSAINQLNLCVIINQQNRSSEALQLLLSLKVKDLKGKEHLYHSVAAEIYSSLLEPQTALAHLQNALNTVENEAEKRLIKDKIRHILH